MAEKYPQDEEKNEYRYIDFAWLDEIAMGLTAGAKKHPGETWRQIPAREHVARAIRHLSMHQTGDASEPHLINASMRCMMAFAMATGRATMAERTDRDAPQVTVTAEEMAMLTAGRKRRMSEKQISSRRCAPYVARRLWRRPERENIARLNARKCPRGLIVGDKRRSGRSRSQRRKRQGRRQRCRREQRKRRGARRRWRILVS